MNLPYRTRRTLRRAGIAVLILLLVLAVVWLCWVIWLERYVVYTREGATLDFNVSAEELSGVVAVEPTVGETIGIYYNEGDNLITQNKDLTQLSGYYADTSALLEGLDSVRQQIRTLEPGTAVMVDVKSIYGNFFYNTGISDTSTASGIDAGAMDKLIRELNEGGLYTIARVPAFRDRSYGEKHVSSGLPTSQGYLWSDQDNCYWLDPADSGAIAYLIRIATELRELGFDEVVFTEFRFSETDQIVYATETPKADILAQTASDLVASCATDSFVVSFQTNDPTLAIPQGHSRLYLADIDASDVEGAAAQTVVADKPVNLVFLAATNDTRYDSYGVRRPLSSAG